MTTALEILEAIRNASPDVRQEIVKLLNDESIIPISAYDQIERDAQIYCQLQNVEVSKQEIDNLFLDLNL
jgi:hypothetical protein